MKFWSNQLARRIVHAAPEVAHELLGPLGPDFAAARDEHEPLDAGRPRPAAERGDGFGGPGSAMSGA